MVSGVNQTVSFTLVDTDYFVAPDGDDNAAGTNWATAFQTIQQGVDAQGTPGRAVIVSNGTYLIDQQIEVWREVVVQSLEGAEKTVVSRDDSADCSCFLLEEGARLDGFSIINGRADGATDEEQSGGGVLAYDSEVVNCIFSNNWAKRVGGGLVSENTTVSNCYFNQNEVEGVLFYGGAGGGAAVSGGKVLDCRFENNRADYGGGLSVSNSWVETSSFASNYAGINGGGLFFEKSRGGADLVFNGNSAEGDGGALYFNDGGKLERAGCTNNSAGGNGGAIYITDNSNADPYKPAECWYVNLHNNEAGGYGGGAYLWHGGMITRSSFSSNSAGISGGGVSIRRSGGIYRSEIFDNVAATNGGGAYLSEGGYLRESTMASNQAQRGAGIYHYYGGDSQNILLTENSASVRGGGIYCYKGGTLNGITTTGNSAVEKGSGFYAYNSASSAQNTIQLENAIVWESTDPIYRYGDAILLRYICSNESYTNGIEKLLAQDPQFLDPASGDYHLGGRSPCINSGTNTSTRALDLDLNARVMGSTMDLGAYEWDFNSDADGDGLPDAWEEEYFGDPTSALPSALAANGINTLEECYHANLDPLSPSAALRISGVAADASEIYFNSSSARLYGLLWSTNLLDQAWYPLGPPRPGVNGADRLPATNSLPQAYYRLGVDLP
jgi:predicted outer membrane repeat protein